MSRISPWFQRKFDFSFPVELYPNVVARLRGTPGRVEESLRGCPEPIRLKKPDGKWSAQEHAGHLADLEPLWTARVADFTRGAPELAVADLTNRRTSEANHNARALEQILNDFRSRRSALLKQVDGISSELFGRALIHPRLNQPMRLVDHLYFVAEHDDHHLAHILELVAP